MLFGWRNELAIESEIRSISEGWFHGRFRLWIDGRTYGDWDDSPDLASGGRAARRFLRASDERTRPDLDERSSWEVFDSLYGQYLGPKASARTPWPMDPYVLDDIGESSLRDRAGVVAVRRTDRIDRIVGCEWGTHEYREATMSDGSLDDVLSQYCRWLASLGASLETR